MSCTGDSGEDRRRLTHLDDQGRARVVDVSGKDVTRRTAVAEGFISMRPETLAAIRAGEIAKGDALTVARIAAIGGAKRASDTVPLCHPIGLDAIDVEIEERIDPPGIHLTVETSVEARTGVEMEALCGVSAGLLAVYDMCKAIDRGMQIGDVRLVSKQGGRSGAWTRNEQ